jgi:dihydrolipoamide dehydrogenase
VFSIIVMGRRLPGQTADQTSTGRRFADVSPSLRRVPSTTMTEPAADDRPIDSDANTFDVAIIGGGGAAEALVAALAGHDMRTVVFEAVRVGGDCPFTACMPSKSMLHDAAVGHSWFDAVDRRRDVVDDLDDHEHAAQLTDNGATLVRADAEIIAPGVVRAGGTEYTANHIVIATGSAPTLPPIDGIDTLGDRCWTSDDAMTAEERPIRLAIVGGGAIGCEMATLFARFGTEVHVLDVAPNAFPGLPDDIGEIVDDSLRSVGVRVVRGIEIERVEQRGGGVRTTLSNGASIDTNRLLVAAGRHPRTVGIGLERVGIDRPEAPAVGPDGRMSAEGSVWAIGDAAGQDQYTHVANHHAAVVADALVGSGSRRFDEVVTPACVFTDPPVLTIGPRPDQVADDVRWVSARLSETPRWTTDDLVDGFLTIGVDVHTRTVVAAHGVGAGFDVLAAALVTAIDGGLTVDALSRSMWPFPSVGEILGVVYSRAVDSLDAP